MVATSSHASQKNLLSTYWKKRDFKKTKEPHGQINAGDSGHMYIIQKHAASHLHYDFRLEIDGVLKSWAIPKGPSVDPQDKRLAMETEDHPLDYGHFEGTIPEGEYGGGTVMLWDQGYWEPIGDENEGYRKGHLKFKLHGEKLRGTWALVRIHSRSEKGKPWLLIKDKVDKATTRKIDDDQSVLTGRKLSEIAAGKGGKRVWHSNQASENKNSLTNAIAGPIPEDVSPMLATLVDAVPAGDEWLHETKYDGYRVMAHCQNGNWSLLTRNGKDWTSKFPIVAQGLKKISTFDALFDGEVACLKENGQSDFQNLQNSLSEGRHCRMHYYVFDVLYYNGYDLQQTPLLERKRFLDLIWKQAPQSVLKNCSLSSYSIGDGEKRWQAACKNQLEGIISKKANSVYDAGHRSRDWVKTKCIKRQEFVIAGFTQPQGARAHFGALLLGYYDHGKLRYAGHVGTGFSSSSLSEIQKKLSRLVVKKSPFPHAVTDPLRRHVTWVKPMLVAEVEFTEWTQGGNLRHPTFRGLRDDKPAKNIVREAPADAFALTNPDKVLFKKQGITKKDLARYYLKVARYIVPFLQGRPVVLVRCPNGSDSPCFYQKHAAGEIPPGLRAVDASSKKKPDSHENTLVFENESGLMSLVQLGSLEIHPWGSKADDLEHPTWMVFDLDPDAGADWKDVVKGAVLIRDLLHKQGLQSFLKTTGGKGLHVVVPLAGNNTWDEVREFSKTVAEAMATVYPDTYIATMSKEKRKGKIFIDYLRNGRGATHVAPYSTRARDGCPLSVPLFWEELTVRLKPNAYTLKNIGKRLAGLKKDPWEKFFETKQDLPG